MRSVAGTLKVDLAQFRDLEAFATFASDLDAVSKAQLERGYRLVELLKQPLNSPMPVELQVVSVFAGTSGVLDDLPVNQVGGSRRELHEWMQARYSGMLGEIRDTGKLPEGDSLDAAVHEFHDDVRRRRSRPSRRTPPRPRASLRPKPRRSPRSSDGRRSGAGPPQADQEHPVDAEDHARAGADRGEPHRRARRRRVAAAQPYSESITQVVQDLARGGGRREPAARCPASEIRRVAHIVIAGDRGLCGAYNTSVIRAAERSVLEHQRAGPRLRARSWSAARPRGTSGTATTPSTPRSRGSRDRPAYEDARAVGERGHRGVPRRARSTSSRSCTRGS